MIFIKFKKENKMTFIQEIKIRKKLESPQFFQKLGNIGRKIAIVSGILSATALSLATGGIAIPVIITTVLASISALGETIKKVSDLTVSDKDKSKLAKACKTEI